jgi:hypothetical protein
VTEQPIEKIVAALLEAAGKAKQGLSGQWYRYGTLVISDGLGLAIAKAHDGAIFRSDITADYISLANPATITRLCEELNRLQKTRFSIAQGETHWEDCWKDHYECAQQRIATLEAKVEALTAQLDSLKTLRPRSEYHEDHGSVVWWHYPIQEPPIVGSPLDTDWDEEDNEWYTHWSPLPYNPEPQLKQCQERKQ